MSVFVTGATGFLGRHLVAELLERHDSHVYVLVRPGSRSKLEALRHSWGHPTRVTPVTGDLTSTRLGVSRGWAEAHHGEIEHLFHLAAVYDLTASDELNEQLNVGGTAAALQLAEDLAAQTFHLVSSVAVAGDFEGTYDETMFDVGQGLPTAYHRTKFEAERLVRDQTAVPWRIYRPSIVVGHSETGAMDKVDGPDYFFPLFKRLRDSLPSWVPLLGVDLGDTNLVPVDHVAQALDHLAHLPGRDGETFHLVHPEPQPTLDVINAFGTAARAPRFVVPVDRSVTGVLPSTLLPRALRPAGLVSSSLRTAPAQLALRATIGRLGIPPVVLEHVSFSATFASRRTEQALAGSGLTSPELETYALALWNYWEEHLDTDTARDKDLRAALAGRVVVVTGASSGIGRVTALKVAQAGGVPLLVARGKDKLEAAQDEIRARGGTAYVYPCDLADLAAVDALCLQIIEEHPRVDYVVNSAGRSIRRSVSLSHDRFHDFERTMQINYFGAVRLIMGLLPTMRAQRAGHIVNISSIGVQTSPPRFSAYVASKAALDAWSNVVSSELLGDGVSFTTIHMPLVKTPMIAPSRVYEKFPTISPAQAADLVLGALCDRPREVNTLLGTFGAVVQALAPRTASRVLHVAFQAYPDSPAARAHTPEQPPGQQKRLARMLAAVHW